MVRWAVELSEFDVQYETRGSIKGQVYTNFVVELSSADAHQEEANFRWVLSIDESSNQQGSGAGVILEGPNELLIEHALGFAFKASNFVAEESNEERKVNLDLLDEVKEEARIKAEALKRRVEYKHSGKLKPRQFQVADLVM